MAEVRERESLITYPPISRGKIGIKRKPRSQLGACSKNPAKRVLLLSWYGLATDAESHCSVDGKRPPFFVPRREVSGRLRLHGPKSIRGRFDLLLLIQSRPRGNSWQICPE